MSTPEHATIVSSIPGTGVPLEAALRLAAFSPMSSAESASVVVDAAELRATCAALAASGARLLTVVATDERALPTGGYCLRYVFAGGVTLGQAYDGAGVNQAGSALTGSDQASSSPTTGDGAAGDGATSGEATGDEAGADRTGVGAYRLTSVECRIDAARPEFPSVAPGVPAVHWDEREIRDLFGLEPLGHPDLRRLVLHDDWPAGRYPLRRDFDVTHPLLPPIHNEGDRGPVDYYRPDVHGEGVMQVPVGPIHAGIIEPGHFRFSTAGERILHLDARLFYTHRGLEKSAERQSVDRVLAIAERLCGVCSVAHAVAYCQAVEALAGITGEIPLQAQYVRAIAAELERLYNHIGDIGNVCAGVGFAAGAMHGARLREALLRLNETVLGHRYLRSVCIPGGVRRGLSARFAEGLARELYKLRHDFHRYVPLLADADSFQERLLETGVVSRETAQALGATGIAARASGVDVDLRRDLPYGAYAWHQEEFFGDDFSVASAGGASSGAAGGTSPAARHGPAAGARGEALTTVPATAPATGTTAGTGMGATAGTGGRGTRRGAWPSPRRDGLSPWRIGPSLAAEGRRGVPVYPDGDVRARVQLRIDETYRSFNLLQIFLEQLREPAPAEAPWRVPLGALPAYRAGIGWAESPRGGNVHWLMMDDSGRVFRYHVRSSSFANWPCVAMAAPGNMIPDFPLINKSFELCYSCCDR